MCISKIGQIITIIITKIKITTSHAIQIQIKSLVKNLIFLLNFDLKLFLLKKFKHK
jgi:hypothetical protein